MKNKLIIILSFLAFIYYACSSTEKAASSNNVAGIYMPGLNLINPEVKIFHKNDTLTDVHFRLKSSDILYTKKRNDSTFSANLLINYQLKDKGTDNIIDSASIYFTDYGNNKEKKHLDGVLPLKTVSDKNYDLILTFNDLSRDHYIRKKYTLNRSSMYNAQNYLFLDSNMNVVFRNHFSKNDVLHVLKNEQNSANSILLKHYSSDLPIAKPPFSVDEGEPDPIVYKPTSTETLDFDSLNTLTYTVEKTGLYHFQQSESNKAGATFFNFQQHFPEIKSAENMIGPLRYISTKKEYVELIESTNKKIAVDKFWLDKAGSVERAKTLIREYYTRVESSNNYFTSYLEGWKTDRGIIYIIFGSPNVVYKNKDYENWIYGEENNMMSISFVFHKVENPISNNDYALSRSPIFKNTWFRAVDSWRNGRIY